MTDSDPAVTDSDPDVEVEPIFIAASIAESEFVERLLEREGIDYQVRTEPFVRSPFSSVCCEGVLFEVLAGQAEYCRRVIRDAGLARGVVSLEAME